MRRSPRYLTTGLIICLALVGAVSVIRWIHGIPPPLSPAPAKSEGPDSAAVHIVEFSDYACGYCYLLQPTLKRLLQAFPNDLQITQKHFAFKENSPRAAEAAECAADQGKFWPYAQKLFNDSPLWHGKMKDPDPAFRGYAKELGLDEEKFNACLDSGVKKAAVEADRREAKGYLVDGTPTLILNSRKILTRSDYEGLKRIIESEIDRQKSQK